MLSYYIVSVTVGVTKLLLHIGQTKTGTTSIQSLFNDNQDLLSKNGIHYLARPGTAKSHRYLFHLLYLECYQDKNKLINKHLTRLKEINLIDSQTYDVNKICEMGWSLLMNSVVQSDSKINVISEELFWHLGSFDQKERIKLLKILKKRLCQFTEPRNISIAVSLRFPSDWAESWHNQLVKDAANTTLIQKFLHNLSLKDTFSYGKILSDWSQVFQGSQLILKDFHAELLHGSHIFPLNFLTYYGLNNYMSTDEMNLLALPPKQQESIHPFLHHWLTINKPLVATMKRRRQLIQKASLQIYRYADRKFSGQKFTLINEKMATQISEYVNTSDNYIKDFEWCEKSTKILDKQCIPRPIPARARTIIKKYFG